MTDYLRHVYYDCDLMGFFGFLGNDNEIKAKVYRDLDGDLVVIVRTDDIELGQFGPFSDKAISQIVAGLKSDKDTSEIVTNLMTSIKAELADIFAMPQPGYPRRKE